MLSSPQRWCGVRRLRELWQLMAEATGADEFHADQAKGVLHVTTSRENSVRASQRMATA
jgi:hypothetical protein